MSKIYNGECESKTKENSHNSVTCKICQQSYGTRKALRKHIKRVHENKRPFCTTCSKIVSNMKLHIARFHQKKKSPCDICSKTFITKHDLKIHIEDTHVKDTRVKDTHVKDTHVNKFLCDVCSEKFSSTLELKDHAKKKHDKEIIFQCVKCGIGFTERKSFHTHLDLYHSGTRYMYPRLDHTAVI